MEEEFKQALADIWGVEDEDELPDALQVLKNRDGTGGMLLLKRKARRGEWCGEIHALTPTMASVSPSLWWPGARF